MQPIKEVELSRVLLDLENYRIPSVQASQEDALCYLFASENVLELAEQIAHDGYLDNELPLVTPAETEGKQAGEFIVLEGNRRVAALKALQGLVSPESHHKELNKLRRKHAHELRNLPKTIRVMVMDSRESALPHLGRMHIGESKRRWSRDQQATFYYSLLDEEVDVSVLRRRFPNARGLKRLLKMASVRRFISHANFKDSSLRAYAASADLTMSSFEYAYNKGDIAEAIGVVFNGDGLIEPSPEKAGEALTGQKLVALEILLSKYRSKELNTRSLALRRGTPEREQLIAQLNGTHVQKQSDTQHEEIDSESPVDRSGPRQEPSNKSTGPDNRQGSQDGTASQGRNHPHTYSRLDMTAMEDMYRGEQVPGNVQTLFIELQRINVRDFSVASTMLMRAVLEATLKLTLTTEERGDANQLRALMHVVQQKAREESWPCRANVNNIAGGNESRPGSVTWFNLVAHDYNLQPTSENIHQAWSLVYPVIEHMLMEGSRRP
ncbi:hypothetical protein QPC17_00185 [Trueperella bernardiae]|uniref:hypothetical protein n=2 Tax=Trueperella bernardiae TaxID=59561 RepID=UPI002557B6FE|nr:hypothetical protein [Trueperella bernardiae]WIM08001.1 hypothetical protein QPC17_00185 [Trueperella bernardiae]